MSIYICNLRLEISEILLDFIFGWNFILELFYSWDMIGQILNFFNPFSNIVFLLLDQVFTFADDQVFGLIGYFILEKVHFKEIYF